MSKYQPFADYLSQQTYNRLRLSFSEIEEILGFSLPESARKYNAWLGNSRTDDSHSWAHLWLRAGWERDTLDLQNRQVEFQRFGFFDLESPQAVEGYEIDRKILTRSRNPEVVRLRRELDNYTCQSCGFSLKIEEKWIIEVHHLNPFQNNSGEVVTRIEDLVSLCPTCHRIAHTKKPAFKVEEIKELLKREKK